MKGAPKARAPRELRKMLANKLGHLEHVDNRLAAKHGLQRVIRIDVPLILFILELVLLDVDPKFLGDLTAGKRTFTDHCRELLANLHRFHKR